MRLGRGLDIDVPAAFAADDLGDLVHDLLAQPLALDRFVHGNPIQVVAADGQGDGAIAGVADHAAVEFGEDEVIAARRAFFQAFVGQFHGTIEFHRVENARRFDEGADCGKVGRGQFGAKGDRHGEVRCDVGS